MSWSEAYRAERSAQQERLRFDFYDEQTGRGDPVAEARRQQALPQNLPGKLDLFLRCASIAEVGLAGIKLEQAVASQLAALSKANRQGVAQTLDQVEPVIWALQEEVASLQAALADLSGDVPEELFLEEMLIVPDTGGAAPPGAIPFPVPPPRLRWCPNRPWGAVTVMFVLFWIRLADRRLRPLIPKPSSGTRSSMLLGLDPCEHSVACAVGSCLLCGGRPRQGVPSSKRGPRP